MIVRSSVEVRRPGADVDVADVQSLEMVVELRLKFCSVVGLHHVHTEWEASEDFVGEWHRRALVARVIDLENANARAIVDRGELVETLPGARDALQKFHVHLEAVTGLGLLVSRPALRVRPMLLVGRQPAHAVFAENTMHRGGRHRQLMKPLQVVRNLARTEVVMLPEIQNLADDLLWCGSGRAVRRSGPVAQPGLPVFVEPPLPLVKRPSGNPEMAARACHVSGACGRLLHDLEPPAA